MNKNLLFIFLISLNSYLLYNYLKIKSFNKTIVDDIVKRLKESSAIDNKKVQIIYGTTDNLPLSLREKDINKYLNPIFSPSPRSFINEPTLPVYNPPAIDTYHFVGLLKDSADPTNTTKMLKLFSRQRRRNRYDYYVIIPDGTDLGLKYRIDPKYHNNGMMIFDGNKVFVELKNKEYIAEIYPQESNYY